MHCPRRAHIADSSRIWCSSDRDSVVGSACLQWRIDNHEIHGDIEPGCLCGRYIWRRDDVGDRHWVNRWHALYVYGYSNECCRTGCSLCAHGVCNTQRTAHGRRDNIWRRNTRGDIDNDANYWRPRRPWHTGLPMEVLHRRSGRIVHQHIRCNWHNIYHHIRSNRLVHKSDCKLYRS